MPFVIIVLLLVATLLLFRWLHGADLSRFDRGYPAPIAGEPPSDASHNTVQEVEAFSSASGGGRPTREKVGLLRAAMDSIGDKREVHADIRPSEQGEPAGEWVLTEGCDSRRRLLYIHGGGFIAGSPKSHRSITSALGAETGMSVFALDYRLVPEHPRLAGLEDSINALEWLAAVGPDGPEQAETLVVAGDSAGGNFTLATLQAVRDRGGRQADAAVAICPSTDITLRSPSLKFNLDSDIMLGRSFGRLLRVPAMIRHGMLGLAGKRSPASPALSPLRGDLSGLPPVLLQASLSEMLLDDAARYYHRAADMGATVEFETFANMVHVWHLFNPELPEACIAIARIGDFLRRQGCAVSGPRQNADAGEAS